MTLQDAVRRMVPAPIRELRWLAVKMLRQHRMNALPLAGKFDEIYRKGHWGRNDDGSMSSGTGTRDSAAVAMYADAVRKLLSSQFDAKPSVVDIGCGDFQVGSLIRPSAGRYVACDISRTIIAQNLERYSGDPDLAFQVLNAVDDPLPDGDIVTIRQVLQHLSNAHIQQIVPKLAAFRYVIVTEDVPAGPFVPNADHQAGFSVRPFETNSGVDLAAPPFNLPYRSATVLCEAREDPLIIRTTAYEMA